MNITVVDKQKVIHNHDNVRYWKELLDCQTPILFVLSSFLEMCEKRIIELHRRMIESTVLPRSVHFHPKFPCTMVFTSGRMFLRKNHIVLSRLCKQFPNEMLNMRPFLPIFERAASLSDSDNTMDEDIETVGNLLTMSCVL